MPVVTPNNKRDGQHADGNDQRHPRAEHQPAGDIAPQFIGAQRMLARRAPPTPTSDRCPSCRPAPTPARPRRRTPSPQRSSPPSTSRRRSSSVSSKRTTGRSCTEAASSRRVIQTNARVDRDIQQVHPQVDCGVEEREQQHDRDHHRIVARKNRIDRQPSQARNVEDRFDNKCRLSSPPNIMPAEVAAAPAYCRGRGRESLALAQALGTSGADIVLRAAPPA